MKLGQCIRSCLPEPHRDQYYKYLEEVFGTRSATAKVYRPEPINIEDRFLRDSLLFNQEFQPLNYLKIRACNLLSIGEIDDDKSLYHRRLYDKHGLSSNFLLRHYSEIIAFHNSKVRFKPMACNIFNSFPSITHLQIVNPNKHSKLYEFSEEWNINRSFRAPNEYHTMPPQSKNVTMLTMRSEVVLTNGEFNDILSYAINGYANKMSDDQASTMENNDRTAILAKLNHLNPNNIKDFYVDRAGYQLYKLAPWFHDYMLQHIFNLEINEEFQEGIPRLVFGLT